MCSGAAPNDTPTRARHEHLPLQPSLSLNEKLPRTPTSQALTSGDGLRNLWVFLRRDLLAQVYEQMTLSQMKIKRIHVC